MTRCRAMDWRSAAACLLVFCLALSAILHFASQVYPDIGGGQATQSGMSAPAAELALVLGNKVESPCSPELAPAIFVRPNCPRLFSRNGGLRALATDRRPPKFGESATGIRGPPPPSTSS